MELNSGIKFVDKQISQLYIELGKLHGFVQETLLAAVAIQPFITNVLTLSGWQLRTLGISSAVRLHRVGNHYHFSSLFAWQTKQSYLGLGVQYWAIDWHPGDSASVRHNMEHHCHKLQFMGDLQDSSGNNLCSCCSFGCCCWCDHL
jgi:hypothetical protein